MHNTLMIAAIVLIAGCDAGIETRPGHKNAPVEREVQEEPAERRRFILEVAKPGMPAVHLEGVTETHEMVHALDENGQPMIENGHAVQSKVLVREAWFKGIRRPFRVGDTLKSDGKQYTVVAINRSTRGTSVEFELDFK